MTCLKRAVGAVGSPAYRSCRDVEGRHSGGRVLYSGSLGVLRVGADYVEPSLRVSRRRVAAAVIERGRVRFRSFDPFPLPMVGSESNLFGRPALGIRIRVG